MKLQKLLVPVDFSRCSETALRYVKLMATKFSARIDIIHRVVRLLPCPVLCVPQEDVDTETGEK